MKNMSPRKSPSQDTVEDGREIYVAPRRAGTLRASITRLGMFSLRSKPQRMPRSDLVSLLLTAFSHTPDPCPPPPFVPSLRVFGTSSRHRYTLRVTLSRITRPPPLILSPSPSLSPCPSPRIFSPPQVLSRIRVKVRIIKL